MTSLIWTCRVKCNMYAKTPKDIVGTQNKVPKLLKISKEQVDY